MIINEKGFFPKLFFTKKIIFYPILIIIKRLFIVTVVTLKPLMNIIRFLIFSIPEGIELL